jgi:hypothetical protein
MALGDRGTGRRLRREIPHTETKPYLRNAALPSRFDRHLYVSRWRPDWLAGAGGFERLHLRIRIGEDSPLGAGALERAHLD